MYRKYESAIQVVGQAAFGSHHSGFIYYGIDRLLYIKYDSRNDDITESECTHLPDHLGMYEMPFNPDDPGATPSGDNTCKPWYLILANPAFRAKDGNVYTYDCEDSTVRVYTNLPV